MMMKHRHKIIFFWGSLTLLIMSLISALLFVSLRKDQVIETLRSQLDPVAQNDIQGIMSDRATHVTPQPAHEHIAAIPKSLVGGEKERILQLVLAVQKGLSLSHEEREESIQTLGQYGEQVLATIADELERENSSVASEALQTRISLLDALGQAAKSNAFARARLKAFTYKPLDLTKEAGLIHSDLMDRLEGFEYIAAHDQNSAIGFIKRIGNPALRTLYIKHFAIGLKIAGYTEDDALKTTNEIFKGYEHA